MNMNQLAKIYSGIAVFSLCLNPATVAAQDDGVLQDLLVQALSASANGECPSSIMAPMLRGTCQQQMPHLEQNLSRLGPIQEAHFMGMQETQMGPAEVYQVEFQRGNMMWMINTAPDGKIMVLWSPG